MLFRSGLVDSLGDFGYAAKLASQLAGKNGKYDLVYPRRQRESFWDLFFESATNQLSRSLAEKTENLGLVSYLYYPRM